MLTTRSPVKQQLSGNAEVWTYTPGNGTLYKFLVVRFPNGAMIGGSIGEVPDSPCCFVYSHLSSGRGHLFRDGSYLAPQYVAEKMDVEGEDLAATIVALGTILNSKTGSYEELAAQFTEYVR